MRDPVVPRPGDAPGRPNLLVVVLDDVGAESWNRSSRGFAGRYPRTPNLDALADAGLLFENAWSHPTCTPSRAAALTGRSPVRSGAGTALAVPGDWHLPPGTPTIADTLRDAGYATAAIGKWHLGERFVGGLPVPDDTWGFDHTAGTIANLDGHPWAGPLGYYGFLRHEDGAADYVLGYATTRVVDDTLDWIAQTQAPWFAWVAFQAAHAPFQLPPEDLVETRLEVDAPDLFVYGAMIEALDVELGRLLAEVPENTTIVLFGDNGMPFSFLPPPFDTRAKGTTYEGGIHVPLVVAGAGVAGGRTSDALVSVTDLAPTLASLGGAFLPDPDGVDFSALLDDPDALGPREFVFAHGFNPNFDPNGARPLLFPGVGHAVRDARYKLRQTTLFGNALPEELYDLVADPGERADLLLAPDADALAAAARLRAALDDALAGTPFAP